LYLARGFLFFSDKVRSYLRSIVQIAYILPSLFSILICLNLLPIFPYGHLGVIFIFFIVHLGFSVVYIAEVLQNKVGRLGLISSIYNFKKTDFLIRIVLPLVRKDLLVLGLIIFLSCISSLAIPLVAGGGKGTNLEVYIYEKIFIEQRWTEAVLLGLFQSAILFAISNWILAEKKMRSASLGLANTYNLTSKTAAIFLMTYLAIYAGGYLLRVLQLMIDLPLVQIFDQDFLSALFSSIYIFLGLSAAFMFFLFCCLYFIYRFRQLSLINLFLSPSTVLIGFGMYLIFPVQFVVMDYLKVILGLLFLFAVGLYQTYLATSVAKLQNQILLCHIYKINFSEFVTKIFWPQTRYNIYFLISLVYLISMNEFAFIKASGAQIQTVGTLTEMYLNSYRMNQAYLLSAFSLFTWIVMIFVLRRFHVYYRKS
jgi:thiamine transport system permease protein